MLSELSGLAVLIRTPGEEGGETAEPPVIGRGLSQGTRSALERRPDDGCDIGLRVSEYARVDLSDGTSTRLPRKSDQRVLKAALTRLLVLRKGIWSEKEIS